MSDLESRLRALYEDIRVSPPGMPRSALRRIKLRRATNIVMATMLAAGFGTGIFVTSNILSGRQRSVEPVLRPRIAETPSVLAATIGALRVGISFQPSSGAVCYIASFDTQDLRSLQIAAQSEPETSVIDLFPSEYAQDDPPGRCVFGIERRTIDSILEAPNQFVLVAETASEGESTSPLSALTSLPSPSESCGGPVQFEPTYLPRRWSPQLQAGSGSGGAPEEVIGHYGLRADPGTPRYMEAGFLDLVVRPPTFDAADNERLEVLGQPAVLARGDNGNYGIAFSHNDCGYALVSVGVTRRTLVRFATNLTPATNPSK